jgi:hypothetical protein
MPRGGAMKWYYREKYSTILNHFGGRRGEILQPGPGRPGFDDRVPPRLRHIPDQRAEYPGGLLRVADLHPRRRPNRRTRRRQPKLIEVVSSQPFNRRNGPRRSREVIRFYVAAGPANDSPRETGFVFARSGIISQMGADWSLICLTSARHKVLICNCNQIGGCKSSMTPPSIFGVTGFVAPATDPNVHLRLGH